MLFEPNASVLSAVLSKNGKTGYGRRVRKTRIFFDLRAEKCRFFGGFRDSRLHRFGLWISALPQPLSGLEMLWGETHLGFESLTLRQKKDSPSRWVFSFLQMGFEPKRAFGVKKIVRWTVFSQMSLSGSESQFAFCAAKGGESLTLRQKPPTLTLGRFLCKCGA